MQNEAPRLTSLKMQKSASLKSSGILDVANFSLLKLKHPTYLKQKLHVMEQHVSFRIYVYLFLLSANL